MALVKIQMLKKDNNDKLMSDITLVLGVASYFESDTCKIWKLAVYVRSPVIFHPASLELVKIKHHGLKEESYTLSIYGHEQGEYVGLQVHKVENVDALPPIE